MVPVPRYRPSSLWQSPHAVIRTRIWVGESAGISISWISIRAGPTTTAAFIFIGAPPYTGQSLACPQ